MGRSGWVGMKVSVILQKKWAKWSLGIFPIAFFDKLYDNLNKSYIAILRSMTLGK